MDKLRICCTSFLPAIPTLNMERSHQRPIQAVKPTAVRWLIVSRRFPYC
jgi:hypothetical protein